MKFWNNLKAWQKGAIIGGIWGAISIPLGIIAGTWLSEMGWGNPHRLSFFDILYVVAIPMFLSWKLIDSIEIHGNIDDVLIIFSPILIGTLIGSGIGYLIDKYRKVRL